MSRRRVVVAGLGDSGVLTAIRLARHVDVVGISAKPGLLSGQELGVRLSRPNAWARYNWITFDRYRGLDSVRTVHGTLTGVDTAARKVFVIEGDGTVDAEPYDTLVISTGVSNGFWRRPGLQSALEITSDLGDALKRLAAAGSVLVIGGGAPRAAPPTWPRRGRPNASICTFPATGRWCTTTCACGTGCAAG